MIKLLCFIFISVFFTNAFSAEKFENILKVDSSGTVYLRVGNMFERKKNIPEYMRFLTRIEADFFNLTESCAYKEPELQAEPMHILTPQSRDILKGIVDKKTNTITGNNVIGSLLSRYAVSEEHGAENDDTFKCKKFFLNDSMFDPSKVAAHIRTNVASVCTSLPELTACLNRVNEKNEKLYGSIQRNTKKHYVDDGKIFESLVIVKPIR